MRVLLECLDQVFLDCPDPVSPEAWVEFQEVQGQGFRAEWADSAVVPVAQVFQAAWVEFQEVQAQGFRAVWADSAAVLAARVDQVCLDRECRAPAAELPDSRAAVLACREYLEYPACRAVVLGQEFRITIA